MNSNLQNYLKTLAEPNRLKILDLLSEKKLCVCQIHKKLKLPQNLTSMHLKQLKNIGLIKNQKDGLKVYYWIDKNHIKKFNKLINNKLKLYEK